MAPAKDAAPIGGQGKIVEAGRDVPHQFQARTKKRPGYPAQGSRAFACRRRGGHTRSVVLSKAPSREEIVAALHQHVHPESTLHTDGAQYYKHSLAVAKHRSVNHSAGEYARKENGESVHVNSLEGFFSVFKRGMVGTYQKVSETHLHRYVAEFDFRQNTRERLGVNDVRRAEIALKGFRGKRLTYQTTAQSKLSGGFAACPIWPDIGSHGWRRGGNDSRPFHQLS